MIAEQRRLFFCFLLFSWQYQVCMQNKCACKTSVHAKQASCTLFRCITCRIQHPCLSASHACKPQGEGGQTAPSIHKCEQSLHTNSAE